MGVWRVGEKNTQILQGSGDVGIGLIAYSYEMGVGTVYVKVNAATIEVPVWAIFQLIVEGTDFHRIGHGCFGYGRGGIRVVPRLSRRACVFIFV